MSDKSLQTNKSIMLAEKRVLNSVFHDVSLLSKYDDSVMVHGVCASVMRAMSKIVESKTELTKGSLLQRAEDIDLNVDPELIESIVKDEEKDDVSDAIRVLQEAKFRLSLKKKLQDAADKIDEMNFDPENPDLEKLREILDSADTHFRPDSEKKVQTMVEWLDEYEEERNKRKNGNQYEFHDFMFDTLIQDGATPGTIGIIASQSGSGKSTLALHLVRSLVHFDVPCMYFSLEMSNTSTADRMMSAESGTAPYSEFVRPPDPASFDAISKVIKSVRSELDGKTNFRICDSPDISIKDIDKHVRKLQKDIGSEYAVVVIDLLSMVKEFSTVRPGMNYADSVTVAINSLSAVAKNLGVHIIGVVQMNRASEESAKSIKTWDDLESLRPNRSQIKSAGAYLERARYVISSFRKMFWAEQLLQDHPTEFAGKDDICEVAVLKQNNGAIGRPIEAIFDADHFDLIPVSSVSSKAP